MDLIGKTVRRLTTSTIIAVALFAGQAHAQNVSRGLACSQEFVQLRDETERRGRLVVAARHAPPAEACELISDFARSEAKMIKFVEAHGDECAISQRIAVQLKTARINTNVTLKKICAGAREDDRAVPGRQGPTFGPAGPLGDFDKVR